MSWSQRIVGTREWRIGHDEGFSFDIVSQKALEHEMALKLIGGILNLWPDLVWASFFPAMLQHALDV
eukprot:2014672-Amphidinium_carterae.1